MHNTVVIKGSKSGLSVFLEPNISFPELLEAIATKFRESAKFWGAAQMVLTLEGRPMTPEEEFQIVNTIIDNSQIEILCLIDTNAERIERCEKALNEKLMELTSQTGQFYKGNLRRGETLESETSIVIIGDVTHGSKVVAKGNIIILGELKGTVCAGVAGNENAVIVALEMAPMQIKIADVSGPIGEKCKRWGRGAMVAFLDNQSICTKSLKKNMLNLLKFN